MHLHSASRASWRSRVSLRSRCLSRKSQVTPQPQKSPSPPQPQEVPHSQEPPSAPSFIEAELDGDPESRVKLEAKLSRSREVQEGARPLPEYMALPASQYSVLDGSKVERLGEDTFRVFVAPFKFFTFELQPILTLHVATNAAGCVISLLACKLKGPAIIEAQNNNFSARMSNRVEWRQAADQESKELASDISLDVELVVPKWFLLPKAVVRTTGNAVMGGVLAAAVPRFLAHLESDYHSWAAGDDSRSAVSNGSLQ